MWHCETPTGGAVKTTDTLTIATVQCLAIACDLGWGGQPETGGKKQLPPWDTHNAGQANRCCNAHSACSSCKVPNALDNQQNPMPSLLCLGPHC
jgi:hypothetical protein